MYEDVCVICAGLWVGSWRGNSAASYSTAGGAENWGKVRLEGDDDLSLGGGAYVRNVGMGIEGRPVAGGSGGQGPNQIQGLLGRPTARAMRRSSGMSWSSGRTTVVGANGAGSAGGEGMEPDDGADAAERRDGQLLTTLSLLQTFHAHTSFQLSVLESFIPPAGADADTTVYLAPRDILAFELGPLSGFDAKYLEWLALEYAGTTKVVMKRGWRDLLGALFGYA